jgi:antitoxin component YwqK of YwqJK toxin-antitoxin module
MKEIKDYFPNGQLSTHCFKDDNGQAVGRYITYYINGNIHVDMNYSSTIPGVPSGPYKSYWESGNVMYDCCFDLKHTGNFVGSYYFYNDNGSVVEERWYDSLGKRAVKPLKVKKPKRSQSKLDIEIISILLG